MAGSFNIIETGQSPLWDFGWFDVTRFRIEIAEIALSTDADLIQRFVESPMYQRSFCESPDSWGASIGRHGPFFNDKVSSEWFRRVSARQLRQSVASVISEINDSDFDVAPRHEQLVAVNTWINSVNVHRDVVFEMIPPDDDNVRVEWAGVVWVAFSEFLSIRRDLSELTLVVIGLD